MLALYIILGIILFIILVLSVPVDFAFSLETGEQGRASARVGWLFGLVWKDIHRRKEKPEKKPKKKRKQNLRPLLSVFRTRGLPRTFYNLVRRILNCLRIIELNANLRIGLDDPADTGMMCSVLFPAMVFLSPFSTRLRIEPIFEEPTFEIGMHSIVRVFPIQIIGAVLRFVLSPTGLRIAKSMVVSHWK